jgi:hypothetical protein
VGGAVVLIRKATAEYASGILARLSAAFEEYRSSYNPVAFADTVLTADTVATRLQETTVFLATGEIQRSRRHEPTEKSTPAKKTIRKPTLRSSSSAVNPFSG